MTSKQKQLNLKKQMAPYEKSDLKRSIMQLVNTLGPFFLLWFLAFESLSVSYFLTLGISVIAAGFLVRIFIIFHDCCHHSFFKNRSANKIVGTITGIITVFPYHQWQHDHNVHHATSGNLDKRGTGDIWTLTVKEYQAASLTTRAAYRMYRNPLVMFLLGPIYVFLLKNRFNRKGARKNERTNTYLINAAIVGLYALMCWAIGWEAFLMVQGPIFLISGAAGIWLFYVQHTFEDSYFEEDDKWEYVKAAVEGSSFYKLPKVMQWLTGNIGFHHIHHLSPRVPNYNLEDAHYNTAELKNVPTITLSTSLQSLRFRLWDEDSQNFTGYQAAKKAALSKKQNRAGKAASVKP
ncbi:fatty acid desaturase [Aeromicrobium ponti]|uniref:Omega-6 fatty acid desaturase (Delta-12 desaturase) n=1 Tax=Cytobacillus oceanisediminis TaxID=665099 RepID=A0A562JTQ0_9BACI|nr:fatty acid desaturase [Cytobacillus oceanisediminis]TWH86560.1 omega-6 fatty acid desaturase (delta-12 desaturase) [Cytobacillus oceanisediminis]